MTFTDLLLVKAVFSLALGALIGLERERFKKVAGLRTFMLVSLFGTLSANMSRSYSGLMPVSMFAAGALMFAAYWFRARRSGRTGLTTILALAVSFYLGTLSESGQYLSAAAIAVLMTFILAGKRQLHGFARKLTQQELLDALKFLIATVVVLPILPNTTIDPWGIFNPFEMWLLAVLVLSVSFVGYISIRLLGSANGMASTGILGGLVSSTAVASAMALEAKRTPKLLRAAVFSILVASSTMFIRTLFILFALKRIDMFSLLAIPFGGMTLFGWVASLILWFRVQKEKVDVPVESSFAILPALKFAFLYTMISFVSFFAQKFLGNAGVFTASIFAGLGDIDVVTTSMATLVSHGDISAYTGAIAIFLGAMSNTTVKCFLTYSLGTKKLFVRIALAFLAMSVVGALLFFLF